MVFSGMNRHPYSGKEASTGDDILPDLMKESGGLPVIRVQVKTDRPATVFINGMKKSTIKERGADVCTFSASFCGYSKVTKLIIESGVSFFVEYQVRDKK